MAGARGHVYGIRNIYRLGIQNVGVNVGRINVVAVLTGFSFKKICGRFAGTKLCP